MNGLLTHTLQRIDSLQQFYEIEYKGIQKKSKKGMEENRFGMLIDVYLNALSNASNVAMNSTSF